MGHVPRIFIYLAAVLAVQRKPETSVDLIESYVTGSLSAESQGIRSGLAWPRLDPIRHAMGRKVFDMQTYMS
jgi:hypothetical protein